MSIDVILYAFFGGMLPAIIWLYFLLKEDSRCPEPPWMIWFAFAVGMITVPLVLYPQHWSCVELATVTSICDHLYDATLGSLGLKVIIAWAVIEEVLKYLMAAVFILPRKAVDESPDYVIYMITIALGFAAAENALFLLAPLASGNFDGALLTNNLRFIGATLLHVIASAGIGFALAFSYQKSRAARIYYASAGLILAILLHAAFNTLIILGSEDKSGTQTLNAFLLVWSAAVVFFALFEILKYFRYRRLAKNTC